MDCFSTNATVGSKKSMALPCQVSVPPCPLWVSRPQSFATPSCQITICTPPVPIGPSPRSYLMFSDKITICTPPLPFGPSPPKCCYP